MKRLVKALIKGTPLYPVLKTIKEQWEIKNWNRSQKIGSPPYIIKQLTIREFAKKFDIKVFIETGTYRGEMVEVMKNHFDRIYSIELSNELYEKAKQRFVGDDRIKIIHGDSGIELRKVVDSLDQPALFWLDGHYSGGVTAKGSNDTPINEELTHIFNSKQREHVIIIDDARCFGTDPTYPSVYEVKQFVKKNNADMRTEVENDSIRIFPTAKSTNNDIPTESKKC